MNGFTWRTDAEPLVCWAAGADFRNDVLEMLLVRRADPNARDGEGHTALMCAAFAGNAQAVRTLLAHGADPNLRSKHGDTALSTALQLGHTDVVALLKRAGAKGNGRLTPAIRR
jgi:ankyrin repeat protein